MGSPESLKAALRENGLTLEELWALSEVQAKKLPLVGNKVLAEAKKQFAQKHRVIEVTIRITVDDPTVEEITPEFEEYFREEAFRGARDLISIHGNMELVPKQK